VEDVLASSPGKCNDEPGEGLEDFSFKLIYYLISTMNLVFPDYDFSDVSPEAFILHPNMQQVVEEVNNNLFNAGLYNNTGLFREFTERLWQKIIGVIELNDCDIYSFEGNRFDADENPFWEKGCM
jgi:hypothetical protein